MINMVNSWTSYIIATVLTVTAICIYIWNEKKRKYVRVGKVSKLLFYPVKSLKGIEVTKGKCTKYGFEVNGILDRSFMLVDEDGILISQREAPSLVLLAPHISDDFLIINGSNIERPLKIKIKQLLAPNDKIIKCRVHSDVVEGIDCGDEAASWFETYIDKKDVRLVQFFPSLASREYIRKDPFYRKLRRDNPAGFQDLLALHLLSKASIDDLNSRIGENKISVHNFRPNILVQDCAPYAEDSWKYIKVNKEAQLTNLILTTRCLMTTNDPETGILSKQDPLVTLRKYRITADPKLSKILGSVPCLGIGCGVLSPGEIAVGDDIFAVVGQLPKMKEKST